jgi:hypothetical protein
MNLQPYTREDVLERIRKGLYPLARPVVKAIGAVAVVPVGTYSGEVRFEPGYPLHEPFCEVYWTRRKEYNEVETRRIADSGMMTATTIDGASRLKLEVPNPVVGCTYYVYFTPPSQAEVQRIP